MNHFTIDTSTLSAQLDKWYGTPLGRALFECEQSAMRRLLPKAHGDVLVQLGGPSHLDFISESDAPIKLRMGPEPHPEFFGPSVCAELNTMPFQKDKVDVVVMPHLLEFVARPAQLLHDVNDILSPDGTLFILGFNPLSLWGMWRLCQRRHGMPWQGYFHSVITLRRLLAPMGFSTVKDRTLFFRPPVQTKAALQTWSLMENLGPVCWPFSGAVYVLVAKKRVSRPVLVGQSEWVK